MSEQPPMYPFPQQQPQQPKPAGPLRTFLGTTQGKIIAAVVALFLCGAIGAVMNAHGGGATTDQGSSNSNGGGAIVSSTHAPAVPTATHAPTATPKPKSWVTTAHVTGSQNQQTQTYHVPDGSRIVWSVTPNNQYGGNFTVELYNSDNTYNDMIANAITPPTQTGTYNVHGDLDIYFKITCDAGDYDIQIQTYQ